MRTRIYDNEEDIDKGMLSRIQKEFFDGNPVSVKICLEGHSFDEKRNYVLGCMAGPGVGVNLLAHEMGHLVERPVKKLLQKRPIWGFSFGKQQVVLGQVFNEPNTDAQVHTEARAAAYQYSICHHFGIEETRDPGCRDYDDPVAEMICSFKYLPAWYIWINKVVPRCYVYGNPRDHYATLILAEQVRKMHETTHSYENFCAGWNERMDALKKSHKNWKQRHKVMV